MQFQQDAHIGYLLIIIVLYDLAGNGYIPTSSLREILRELDEQLTEEELDGLIQEIDTDGSGTVDFDGKRSYDVHSNPISLV